LIKSESRQKNNNIKDNNPSKKAPFLEANIGMT
jgi:hypothetical protein